MIIVDIYDIMILNAKTKRTMIEYIIVKIFSFIIKFVVAV